jgi:hypothetical protein
MARNIVVLRVLTLSVVNKPVILSVVMLAVVVLNVVVPFVFIGSLTFQNKLKMFVKMFEICSSCFQRISLQDFALAP